jgi:hypothetical protein
LLDAARLAADDVARLVRAVVCNSRSFFTVSPRQVDEERLELIQTALELVGTAPTAERAELLSLLATELIVAGDHRRVLEAADEAWAVALQLEDVLVRARVGARRAFACQVPERATEVAAEISGLVALADASGDPQLRVSCRRPTAPQTVGDLSGAHVLTREAVAIADESGQPGLRSRAYFDHAGALDALGDHQEAFRLTHLAFDLGRQAAWSDAVDVFGGRMAVHSMFEGEPERIVTQAAQMLVHSPRQIGWRAAWALGLALAGGDEELGGFLADLCDLLPQVRRDHFWLTCHVVFATAQGFGVEHPESSGALYDLLLPYRALHASYGVGYWGPVEGALAIAARVKGDVEGALRHHEEAAATIEACGAARARALNGYQWARTLLVRNGPGDRARASELAEESLGYSRDKGYTTFVTKTEELLATL